MLESQVWFMNETRCDLEPSPGVAHVLRIISVRGSSRFLNGAFDDHDNGVTKAQVLGSIRVYHT
jgi:hypothetical protein